MAYRFKDLDIRKIGVIGSGNIGPDIALYFAQSLHPWDVPVVVVDVAPEALERGKAKALQKIAKGRDAGAFKPEAAAAMERALTFTTDYEALRGADLIVEAATENVDIKRHIFDRVAALCGPRSVIASNSSHIEPEVIFAHLSDTARRRALVIHYFFPAERNPLVEIVPSAETEAGLAPLLMKFYEVIGKVPVHVQSRYGFAVNPVFEGLFLAAALAVEEGLGTVKEVDAAARRALGLGVGPFTAMNLTGGNPITNHALDEMTTRLGPWFRSPRLMKDAMGSGMPWDVPKRDEKIVLTPEREAKIADAMRGAYYGLCGQILDSGIVSLADLELGVEIGLSMRSPFASMNEFGVKPALALVEAYAASHPGFAVPRCLRAQAKLDRPFRIDHVLRHDDGDVAVLTIRRPRVQNALNDDVYARLAEHLTELRDNPAIGAVVLTGFGTKSFVSGADVNFLARIKSPADGVETSERSKVAGRLLETMGKPSVCALNGAAIGGGNELAMCCTARIVKKGLSTAVSQPEANLGIVPGAGATQRLPRLIGVAKAAEMLRTGRSMSGREAVESGLIRQEVEGDVVDEAVALARAAARGEERLAAIDPKPITTPASLPPLELGHLSRVVDGLIVRAILEGCRRPLEEGLKFESKMFGECCATEDMKIGVQNFIKNGPKAKAEFANR